MKLVLLRPFSASVGEAICQSLAAAGILLSCTGLAGIDCAQALMSDEG
jgi:hypothetical protein